MSLHRADGKTYDRKGRLIKHTHADQSNTSDILYIKGDEDTDGSIRLIPRDISRPPADHTDLEFREDGIWSPSGLSMSPTSLLLGQGLTVETHGNLLGVASFETATKDLVVAAEFDDSGSRPAKVAVLSPRFNRLVVAAGIADELVTKLKLGEFIAGENTLLANAFRYKFYFKTGSVAATSPVIQTIAGGSIADNGTVFFRREMPASDWPANTEVEVDIIGAINFTPGNSFTTSLSSDNDFSLLGTDEGAGVFTNFFAFDIQSFDFQAVISIPNGTDRFLTDGNGAFISDQSGNMVVNGEQVKVGDNVIS